MALESYSASMPSFGSGGFGSTGGLGLSASTFSNAGGAVADIFAASAYRTKGAGNRIQAQEYDLAQQLSLQNEQFTKTSTAIKTYQQQRTVEGALGQQAADVAASGFGAGGSALDLLRDSASQGALTKQVLGQQGLIEEAGYREQAQSYGLMAQSARMAAEAEDKAAQGAGISAGLKGAAAGASAGAMLGPWGAVAGGVIGGAAGYFGSK